MAGMPLWLKWLVSDVTSKTLWSTPDTPVTLTMTCRQLSVPEHLINPVLGALALLLKEYNWTQVGTETVEDTVEYLDHMFNGMQERCNVIGELKHHTLAVIPDNWLVCDGTQYPRVDYPELYSVLDPVYIVDVDNFVVPDAVDRFLYSAGNIQSVGSSGGQRTVTLNVSQMPQHGHLVSKYSPNVDLEGAGIPDPLSVGLPEIPTQSGLRGGGQPHSNMPPFVALKVAIVAK